jgi:hypothetical protein
MDSLVAQALSLLPTSGDVVFDVYKAQINTAMPDKAKDVFTYILKNQLVKTRVAYDANKKIVVYLGKAG